jgi:DNA primase
MPIAWSELGEDVRFDHFNIRNVPALLRRRRDPWKDLSKVRQKLTPAMFEQLGIRASGT